MTDTQREEIIKFSSSYSWISPEDSNYVQTILSLIALRRDDLESSLFDQIDLTNKISWLTSKYARITRDAEQKLNVMRAEISSLNNDSSRMTQLALDTLCFSDPKYQELRKEYSLRQQWADYLEALKWAIRDRIKIAALIQGDYK